MKSRLKLLAISALLCTASLAMADTPEPARIPELDAMTNEQLITSVPLGKQAQLIRQFQEKEATRLLSASYPASSGCKVETFRDREVIIVTIPAASLFAPNDTVLTAEAARYLDPLLRYAAPKRGREDMYRVLLIMHTDDTGSPAYTDNLSLARVEAVFDYLDDRSPDTRYLFPTAAGATDPIRENNTTAGRAANRRLEVYLIPGQRMLDQAKGGRIAF